MIGNLSIETLYFYTLIVCAGMSVLLFLFGDVFDFDGPVDPMLIVPWFAFTALFGYLGESLTMMNSLVIGVGAVALSTAIIFMLNFYVLVPLRHSESTLSTSEKDMEGRKAQVITPIPIKGMGEIKISNVTGTITRPASFYQPQDSEIKAGDHVLIIEIRERVCYVVPYTDNFI